MPKLKTSKRKRPAKRMVDMTAVCFLKVARQAIEFYLEHVGGNRIDNIRAKTGHEILESINDLHKSERMGWIDG